MKTNILKDLEEWKNPAEINLITDAHVVTFWRELEFFERDAASECEELKKNPFNPEQARKKRLEFLESYGKVIGVPIPYDPRFIDLGTLETPAYSHCAEGESHGPRPEAVFTFVQKQKLNEN